MHYVIIGNGVAGITAAFTLRQRESRARITVILVSYCPLCNSALVFDRRVSGATLEFGVSAVPKADDHIRLDGSEKLPGFLGGEHRSLSALDGILRPAGRRGSGPCPRRLARTPLIRFQASRCGQLRSMRALIIWAKTGW